MSHLLLDSTRPGVIREDLKVTELHMLWPGTLCHGEPLTMAERGEGGGVDGIPDNDAMAGRANDDGHPCLGRATDYVVALAMREASFSAMLMTLPAALTRSPGG